MIYSEEYSQGYTAAKQGKTVEDMPSTMVRDEEKAAWLSGFYKYKAGLELLEKECSSCPYIDDDDF